MLQMLRSIFLNVQAYFLFQYVVLNYLLAHSKTESVCANNDYILIIYILYKNKRLRKTKKERYLHD